MFNIFHFSPELESLGKWERQLIAESLGKEKAEKVIGAAMEKEEELINEGKMRAEEERKIIAEAFSKEAVGLVRAAVAKVVELSPEAVDERLVEKALSELKSMKIR